MFSYLSEKLNVKALGEMIAPTLTPEQQLHQAIEDNLPDKVRHLLDDVKVSPNARTPEGSFPVHTAAYNGRVDILLLLIERGADISALGPRDNTPLHLACAQGHLEMAKLLVAKGANVAQRNKSLKTSYDVATGDTLRQWLLPLQFQHEDPNDRAAAIQQAQNMGLSGFHPSNVAVAPPPPPPTSGAYYGAPPANAQYDPHAALYAPPTHSAIPRHNPSAFTARRDPSVFRPIQADGFGSSVGNAELTAKFGNTVSVAPTTTAPPPPPPGAAAGGYQPSVAPPAAFAPARPAAAAAVPQFKIFNPRAAATSGDGRPQSAGPSQHPQVPSSSGPFSGPSAYSAAAPFTGPPSSPTESSPTHHGDAIDFSATTSALQ